MCMSNSDEHTVGLRSMVERFQHHGSSAAFDEQPLTPRYSLVRTEWE
jgi:hypothetical protein